MCPVFLWQQPQVCNRLCFLDIFSTLQVISICSDSRESWWHNKGSLDCWTIQTCDSNERGRTKECLGWTTENKTNWSNGARMQTGMFCCAFQWHADSKIQSPTNKCQSNVEQLLPASAIHCLFVWIVLNDLITACSAEGKSRTFYWAIPENIHTYTTDGFLDFRRGGGVHDYGILRAWGGIYVWKSEGMGGFHRWDFWSRKCRVSSL